MNYPRETSHCLRHLFPDSVPEEDWSVSIHSDGLVTIDKWNEALGTQPTAEELTAVITEALKTRKFRGIRDERNYLLKETDWSAGQDAPAMSQEWKDYRQALRDLPASNADSEKITFPTKPTE